jgi:hypothetical protein
MVQLVLNALSLIDGFPDLGFEIMLFLQNS